MDTDSAGIGGISTLEQHPELVGLAVRLALDFTEDEIIRFIDAITDMGWRLVPPDTDVHEDEP